MNEIQPDAYELPQEIVDFIDNGFLEVLSVQDDEKTITFHIPSKRIEFTRDQIMTYKLTWIHPEFNEQFCHFYIEKPGDLPNFILEKSFSDDASESVDDLETVDDLVDWLQRLRDSEVE